MVEARLQVLITRFSFRSFSASTFLSSRASMNGPFFSERDIFQPILLFPLTALVGPAANDEAIGTAVVARLIAERWLAPRRLRTWHPDRRAALTATVRVTGRVHRRTAHRWPPTLPAITSGLADLDVAMFQVADLSERRHALFMHHAHFTAWHSQLGIFAFTSDQLSRSARCPRQLCTAPML